MAIQEEMHSRIKTMLSAALTDVCKHGLMYRNGFTVEGLIGITLDSEEVRMHSKNKWRHLIVCKMVPIGVRFWCHFPKGHCFPYIFYTKTVPEEH